MAKKEQQTESKVGMKIALGAAVVATVAAGYFLFGPQGKNNRKKIRGWTLKAKGEILEKIEKTKEMTSEKYHEIIDAVTAKYAKIKDITAEEIERFTSDAKKHWKAIERDLKPSKPSSKK